MREDIRQRLIEVARTRRLITYREVGEELNIPAWWRQLGRLLGEICIYEHAQGRPYLSAIVVRGDTRRAGSGFWGLPDISAGISWEHYRDEVWEYWSRH